MIEFNEALSEKLDHTPLLIDYFATCGIKKKVLTDYISKVKADDPKLSLLDSLSISALKKANISVDVTSRYPPIDKSLSTFPSGIQNFCFPTGYKAITGSNEFTLKSSFVLTNEVGDKTYVSYCYP